MESKLGIANGVDFCAALLLLQTDLKSSAANWLSHKEVPAEVQWVGNRFDTLNLLSKSLAKTNKRLALVIDQLDFLSSDDATSGETLKELIQHVIQFLRENPNTVAIISALEDIAQLAFKRISHADYTRTIDNVVSLSGIYVSDIQVMMTPRLAIIRDQDADVADLIERFLKWIVDAKPGRLQISPRLLLMATKLCIEKGNLGYSDHSLLFSAAWDEATLRVREGSINTPQVNAANRTEERQQEDSVSIKWAVITQESVFPLGIIPNDSNEVVQLLQWSLQHLRNLFPSLASVTTNSEGTEVFFRGVRHNQESFERNIVVTNESFYRGGTLHERLDTLSKRKKKYPNIIVRTVNAFPKGSASKVYGPITRLRQGKCRLLEMREDELLLLYRLQRLQRQVSAAGEFEKWLTTRSFELPTIREIVGD